MVKKSWLFLKVIKKSLLLNLMLLMHATQYKLLVEYRGNVLYYFYKILKYYNYLIGRFNNNNII